MPMQERLDGDDVTDLTKGAEVLIRSADDICNRDRASVRLPNAAPRTGVVS
jgi:hypothetical protein